MGPGEGVELVALNLKHGLDAQHRAQGRRRGGYAPAAMQVFERVDRYVYARREPFLLKYGRGLRRGIAQAQQLHGVEDRLALRGGDALVVHNRDAPVIVPASERAVAQEPLSALDMGMYSSSSFVSSARSHISRTAPGEGCEVAMSVPSAWCRLKLSGESVTPS